MDTIQCKELIVSTIRRRGKGDKSSPIRIITEVYEKDGTKIAENDPMPEEFAVLDLVHFARWVNKMKHDPDKLSAKEVGQWLESLEND